MTEEFPTAPQTGWLKIVGISPNIRQRGFQERDPDPVAYRRALIQLAIGLTIGIAGAFGVGRLLRSMLVQIATADPATLTTIVAVLIAVAVAACVGPSRRATRLDPATALRYK